MSTAAMNEPIVDARPPLRSWLAAFFYVAAIVAGATTVVLDGRVIVRGDAAATVANVLRSESLFRLSFVSNLIATASCIAVTFLVYGIFKAVDGRMSFVAAFVSAEAALIGGLVSLLHLVPLALVKVAQALSIAEAQPLVLRLLELNASAATAGIFVFAVYSLLVAYLAFKSAFLPRATSLVPALAALSALAAGIAPYLSTRVSRFLAACLSCLSKFT